MLSVLYTTSLYCALEGLGHYPDITIAYSRVTKTLSAHDAGGATEQDAALAERTAALV